MNKTEKTRDISTELLRIVAILFVIGTHCKQSSFLKGSPDAMRVLLSCFVGDGVAIFWTILGFYQWKELDCDYKIYLKKIYKKCFIPLFLLTVFIFYFNGFIYEGKNIINSMFFPAVKYKTLLQGFLQWKNVVPHGGHLWFLYVYILLAICLPCFYGIYHYIDKERNKIKDAYILTALFLVLVINDYFQNSIFKFSHYSFNGVLGASLFVILGHILYSYKDVFARKIYNGILIGGLLFLITNVFRCYIQYRNFLHNARNNHVIFWYTSYAFICVIGIVFLVWGISRLIEKRTRLCALILYLGKRTFMVYLIHQLVLPKANAMGVPLVLKSFINNSWAGSIVYQIVYTIMIYCLTLVVVDVFILAKNRLIIIQKAIKR